jgi:hydroxymethylpyrimidine/phosphomethylpyrimidine kinase
MVVTIIDEMLVKNIHTIHITTLVKRRVLMGFLPSPHLLTIIHQKIKAKLKVPQINHQVCTDTRDNPYGSISDINTHHKKLLNIVKNINPNNPEIPEMILIVPIISIFFHSIL